MLGQVVTFGTSLAYSTRTKRPKGRRGGILLSLIQHCGCNDHHIHDNSFIHRTHQVFHEKVVAEFVCRGGCQKGRSESLHFVTTSISPTQCRQSFKVTTFVTSQNGHCRRIS